MGTRWAIRLTRGREAIDVSKSIAWIIENRLLMYKSGIASSEETQSPYKPCDHAMDMGT